LWRSGTIPPWRRGFPFFIAEPRDAIERLRSAGTRMVWTQGSMWKRIGLGAAMGIGWPFVAFGDAARISFKRSREGRAPFWSSFRTLYRAALERNVPPRVGALYEWALDLRATDLADVLLPSDLVTLQRLSADRGALPHDVQDKARFEEICRSRGLPCVQTLAAFDHGVSTGEDVLRTWSKPFFVKALTGNKGAGAELWSPGERGFASTGGEELTIDQLIERLRFQNCIVQPALEDHTALGAFGTVALSSLRIVTARGSSIPATVIAATLSLAVEPGSLTGHSGVQCGIDIETGTVANTTTPVDEDARLLKTNLIGFEVPHWAECVRLARRAHDEAFPAFTTLGWDLVLTSDGPLLLETNVGWGTIGHQKLAGPLGKTALADVIDELLAPAPADRSAADHPSKRGVRSPSPAPREDRGRAGAKGRKRRRPEAKAS